MSISSMTGFARTEGASDVGKTCTWAWEAKSVNGKGLDVRLRLPRGFDYLEADVRTAATKRFKRGNITLALDLKWPEAAGGISVNQQNLDAVMAALAKFKGDIAPPSADGVLALRGVLEQAEDEPLDDDARNALKKDLLKGLGAALDQLAKSRTDEGARLGAVLEEQLGTIEALNTEAEKLAATQPDAIRARLKEQVENLMADVQGLDEARLAQEAALLMIKADVREELDRLEAHIAAARELMADDGAVGRRLDFLCQEFNRESNTLCSKSADVELTRVGLEMKAVIEQFREQVQNIE